MYRLSCYLSIVVHMLACAGDTFTAAAFFMYAVSVFLMVVADVGMGATAGNRLGVDLVCYGCPLFSSPSTFSLHLTFTCSKVLESDAAMVTTEHSLSHVSEWQRSHEPPASDTTPISEAYTGVAVVAAPKPQPSKHPSLDAMALLEKQHKDSLGSNVTYFD